MHQKNNIQAFVKLLVNLSNTDPPRGRFEKMCFLMRGKIDLEVENFENIEARQRL